jgi:hypothetical protein
MSNKLTEPSTDLIPMAANDSKAVVPETPTLGASRSARRLTPLWVSAASTMRGYGGIETPNSKIRKPHV